MADAPSCALLGVVLRARARDRAREAELALACEIPYTHHTPLCPLVYTRPTLRWLGWL